MSTGGVVLVGVAIAVGLIGVLVPLLPGTLLVFGAAAAGVYARSRGQQALDAIPDLVEALRDIEALRNRMNDLTLARVRLLNKVDHKRLAEFSLLRKRETSRSRPRPRG